MIKEERELQFRAYIDACRSKNEYIGLGNPYAKILLIGQEPAQNGNADEHIKKNIDDIPACLNNGDLHLLYHQSRFYKDRKDKNDNLILNRTWNAYQKLIDYIRPEEKRCMDTENTDFCMDAFTTELNNTVSLRQALENKRRLRIETLKESDFIRGFPVIVLACGPYIHNLGDDRQIDDTFGVTFDLPDGKYEYSRGKWFYTHHSRPDRKRLVIHTIQLSQYSEDLLRGMAKVIKDHLNDIGESYEAICY
jgi:hypothetical protein